MSDQVITIKRGFRLQWEEAQGCNVLLYPEGMVKLNGSAGEIMGLVDGKRSERDIIGLLEDKFPGANLADDVKDFFVNARQAGWIA